MHLAHRTLIWNLREPEREIEVIVINIGNRVNQDECSCLNDIWTWWRYNLYLTSPTESPTSVPTDARPTDFATDSPTSVLTDWPTKSPTDIPTH